MPLLRREADIRRVGEHVWPVDVVDGLGLWEGCQVLVVQHLLSEFGLAAERRNTPKQSINHVLEYLFSEKHVLDSTTDHSYAAGN